MTSYNPPASHLKAVEEELSGGSAPTPTYGGTVETGAEWDFIIDKNGRRRYVLFVYLLAMPWMELRAPGLPIPRVLGIVNNRASR